MVLEGADFVRQYFTTADAVVFAMALLLAALIGVFHAYRDRKRKSLKNYYYGGQQLSPIPIGISMAVTYISAITIMAHPADTYSYGLVVVWYGFTTIFPTVLACLYFIPLYHRLHYNTVYQYLENRFHPSVRKFCSCIEIFNQILYMGFTVYLPSLALNAVTPFQLSWIIALTGGICTFYTAFGGIKAVVWTDTLQSAFMLIGVVAALVKGSIDIGGFDKMWEVLNKNGGVNIFTFDIDPRIRTTFWTVIFGFGGTQASIVCVTQSMYQRYLSCNSVKNARIAALFAIVPKILISLVCVFGGAVAYAYFEGCDLVKTGVLGKADQIMPYFVLLLFRGLPGLVGFYVAAVYSGTLSTVSSGINSLAALLLEDFLPVIKPSMSNRSKLLFSKAAVAVLGVLVTSIAYLASVLGGSVIKMVLIFRGACGGPLLGVFLLGLFFPWSNTKGVVTGQITGTILSVWLGVGNFVYGVAPEFARKITSNSESCRAEEHPIFNTSSQTTDVFISVSSTSPYDDTAIEKSYPALYSLCFMYYCLVGIAATIIIGLAVSFATGPKNPKDSDPDLFIPLVDNECLPHSVRSFFRLGVPEMDEDCKDVELKEPEKLSNSIEDEKKMFLVCR